MRGFFTLFILLLIHGSLYAQLSKTHYVPPVAYSSETGSNAIPNQGHYFYISTPSTASVTVNIRAVGGGVTSAVIANSSPYTFTIDAPGGTDESQIAIGASSSDVVSSTSKVITNKGYIVEASSEVYVALRIGSDAQAGALVSKGGAALGTDFRVGAFTNYNPLSNYSSFLSVMASENNTQIVVNNIKDGVDLLDFNENNLGVSDSGMLNDISFTLNRGESYTIITRSDQGTDVTSALEFEASQKTNSDGLIGAYISANKPVVVNSGSMNGSFHNGGGRDFGFDQLVDYSKVGTEYIFVKGMGSDGWENILLVAHSNETTITINGNLVTNAFVHGKGANISGSYITAPVDLSIDAGDYYLIEGDLYSPEGNMYIQSSAPVFAFQGIGSGNSEANQGLFFVPPLKCSSVGDVDNIPLINNIGTTVYTGNLNIISKKNAIITLSDDNNSNQAIESLSVATMSGPFDVLGNVDYQSYVISNLNGNVSLVGNDELYCSYFNQNGAASSGAFYSGFTSPPEFPTEIISSGLYGYCLPNLGLSSGNMDLFTSFEWQYSSGSDFRTLDGSINQATISPTLGGKYMIRGYISCPGEPPEFLDSDSITVSVCPPDTDNDGFLDPIDDCPFAAGVSFLNGCPWPIYIGNNYKTSLTSNTIDIEIEGYYCSLTESTYFNRAYHSGAASEPLVGDFIVYNDNYFFSSRLVFDTEGSAHMKLRDFNKIIQVNKSNGEIIAIYTCP